MFSALTVGILGGVLLGAYLSLRATRRIAAAGRTTLVYWAATAGIALAALPSAFLALAVGGSVGGGTGAELGSYLGSEGVGGSTGVVLGLALVLAAGLLLGAVVGALVGRRFVASRLGP